MRRIRVALLVFSLSIDGLGGGISRFADELSRALDPERFAVSLYALWRLGTPSEQAVQDRLAASGVNTHAGAEWDSAHPYRSYLRATDRLRETFAANPVDIIHSHQEFGDVAAIMLRRAAGAEVLMRTVHNREWARRPLRRLLLTNAVCPVSFDVEAGVSQAIVDTLDARPLARLLRKRARLLHNAINLERFRDLSGDKLELRRRLGVPAEAVLIGSLGRLVKQKGYATFLDAAAQVLAQVPQARFILVGAGNLELALRAQASQLGLAGRLIWAGARPDVENVLGALDLFVSASLWEGLPTVILESMAAGVPVVATDIPGTRELVVNGESGRLAPAGDAAGLAAGIVELLKDDALRARLAARAGQVVDRFSIAAVAGQHEQLYETLAGQALI